MKPISWLGIVFLGALALAYQGINYTRQQRRHGCTQVRGHDAAGFESHDCGETILGR
jgi:hypothetical protein